MWEWRDRVRETRRVREWHDRVSLLVSDATALMSFPRRRESVQCVREWRDGVREAWRGCGNDVMWLREWRDRVGLLVSDATALMSFPRRRESVRWVLAVRKVWRVCGSGVMWVRE